MKTSTVKGVVSVAVGLALFAVHAETRLQNLVLSSSEEAAAAAETDAYVFVGPDAASVTTPCDVTLNNVSVAADTGVVALYGPCLMTTNTTIWKNVDLRDVMAFSAQMGGSGVGSTWRNPQFIGNITTNASTGAITVQFQYKNGPLYMMAVTYVQSGSDVVAKVSKSLYQYNRDLGADFSTYGSARAVTNTVSGNYLCIRRLGCTLKASAAQAPAKTFRLANSMRQDVSSAVSPIYAGCLATTNVVLWRDTDLSRVDPSSFRARMAGLEVGASWKDVSLFCLKTNDDFSVSGQFQYKAGGTVYSAEVTFNQSGADIYACISRFVKQYGVALGTDLGTGKNGAAVAVTNELASAACALSGIGCTWDRPYNYTYGTRSQQYLTTTSSLLWKNVRLADVKDFAARMGGSTINGTWQFVKSYLPVTNSVLNQITVQFQWRIISGSNVGRNCLVQVAFVQEGEDVYARVVRTSYQYDPLGKDISTIGMVVACTDSVSGSGLALKDVTCTRLGCSSRPVATLGALDAGSAQVLLHDIDLCLVQSGPAAAALPSHVEGRGAVRAGFARVADACTVASDGGFVAEDGATVVFDLSRAGDGAPPCVTAASADLSAGASIVLSSGTVFPEQLFGVPLTLISGAGLSPADLDALALSFGGSLQGRCRGRLSVVDGNLVATVKALEGVMVLIR